MFRPLIALAFLLAGAAQAAEGQSLSGQAIKDLVTGSTIELDTPLGTRLPMQYSDDGHLSGRAGGLTSYLGAATDSGQWWVAEDRLCQKWTTWFDAATHCLRLRRDGVRIFWWRDDGKTGTATIVDRAGQEAKATPRAPAKKDHRSANSIPEPRELPAIASLSRLSAAKPPETASPPPSSPRLDEAQPKIGSQTKQDPRVATLPAPNSSGSSARRESIGAERRTSEPWFRVTGVEPFDVLYVRRGPSADHGTVGTIPPQGRVKIVGNCQSEWCPITHLGVEGWVNSYYLAAEAPITAPRPDNAVRAGGYRH